MTDTRKGQDQLHESVRCAQSKKRLERSQRFERYLHAMVVLVLVAMIGISIQFVSKGDAWAQNYSRKQPPLIVAVIDNDIKKIRLALSNPGKANRRDSFGNTLLMLAERNDRKEVFELLLKRGALANLIDTHGRSVIHYLALSGKHEWFPALDLNNPDWDIGDSAGRTPLMLAIEENHTETVGALLKRGARVELGDVAGRNAIDYAHISGSAVLQELLEASAE